MIRLLGSMILADFLERVRRPGIWLVAAIGIGFGYLFIPPSNSQTLMLAFGPWRGVYNSAWVGMVFGMLAVMILPLFTFFVVKNSVSRDRETRVGQIIATTPVKKLVYMLGKWLSNLAVLTLLLMTLSIMAPLMQLYRGEELALDPGLLLAPLWVMGFPVMALVAALAVLFESLPVLQGGVGNFVYFFSWLGYLSQIALPGFFSTQIGMLTPANDLLGVTRPIAALQAFALMRDPGYDGHFNIAGASYGIAPEVVPWEGFVWTEEMVAARLVWLVFAVGIVVLAAGFFDRFDPARRGVASQKPGKSAPVTPEMERDAAPRMGEVHLSGLPSASFRLSSGVLLAAELKLMLHGQSWWLYLFAGVVTLVSLVAPAQGGPPVAVLAWLWPVLVWAGLGTRVAQFHTTPVAYSAPNPMCSQFWMPWLAGVVLALGSTAGLSLRLLAGGAGMQWLGMLAGVVFVPSLALAFGVWSGSGRWFQVVYLLWWFVAANGNTALDFMSFSPETAGTGMPFYYLVLAGVLLLAAWVGRRRQVIS